MFHYWKTAVAGLLALSAGFYLSVFGLNLPSQRPDPQQIPGLLWPNQKALADFELVDQQGDSFDRSRLEGHWTVLFFGYTYCPDICPVTMSMLREADTLYQQQADPAHQQLQVAFVSVDGERDTPEQLANYIRYYNDNWLAASGSAEQVDSLTGQMGVPYQVEDHEPGATNYLVSHTGALFLISPEGTMTAILQPPHRPQEVVDRILSIRRLMDT